MWWQAPNGGAAGLDGAGAADLGVHGVVNPFGEAFAGVEGRGERTFGRHFTVADAVGERGPLVRLRPEALWCSDLLEGEAAHWALVALGAVLLQERLPAFEWGVESESRDGKERS